MIKILIADDDLICRLLLSENLSRFGTCDSVVDGKEAVRAYMLAVQRERPYDLICLDIMMPNMSGIEALSQIREIEKENGYPEEKQVKVIMITALVDELTKKTARIAKCNHYITKPVDNEELIKKIRELKLI